MARSVKCSLSSRTSDQNFVCISHACYMSHIYHPLPSDLPYNDDTKLFHQHAALRHFQTTFCHYVDVLSFTTL